MNATTCVCVSSNMCPYVYMCVCLWGGACMCVHAFISLFTSHFWYNALLKVFPILLINVICTLDLAINLIYIYISFGL